MNGQPDQTYTIRLPQFEGPFDLLLFFIERDELDIYNIPIAKITEDFLDYLRQMESLNVDLASEFILVAATLCRIKARLLLPRRPLDEHGNELDPREELVHRLLEYKRYKSVLDEMRELESQQHLRLPRGSTSEMLSEIAQQSLSGAELESITLYKLLRAFERVMERLENRSQKVVHTVMRFHYNVQDQQAYIFDMLKKKKKVDFESLFQVLENRIHAIVTFLALLELLNLQQIQITQGAGANNFWIRAAAA